MEDYVTFEQAKLLKKKGFPKIMDINPVYNSLGIQSQGGNRLIGDGYIACPTLSFVQKWLFEEKHIFISINPYFSDPYICYKYIIYVDCDNTCEVAYEYETNLPYPEEALSAALDKALELI